MSAEIYYIHDPMCSWCWGFSKTYTNFLANLDKNIKVKRLLGGLAPDSDEPMPDDVRKMVLNAWHRNEKNIPGVKFNFDFWEVNVPRRSTFPACRAVIAARNQGQQYDDIMTKAIQTAYYQNAQNPSDLSVLTALADDIGLDVTKFEEEISSSITQETLLNEIEQAHRLKANSYPSLILKKNQSIWSIPIDYNDDKPMLETMNLLLSDYS
jgi:putative protein-disulfide isomerase